MSMAQIIKEHRVNLNSIFLPHGGSDRGIGMQIQDSSKFVKKRKGIKHIAQLSGGINKALSRLECGIAQEHKSASPHIRRRA